MEVTTRSYRHQLDYFSSVIAYAHRSIPDFLENNAVKDEMESFLFGFNPVGALCQFSLAKIRFASLGVSDSEELGTDASYFISETLSSLILMRQAHDLDHAPFTFLRLLDASTNWFWKVLETNSIALKLLVNNPRTGVSFPLASTTGPLQRADALPPLHVPNALLICTFLFSGHGYTMWSITNDPASTDSTTKVVLLAYALLGHQHHPRGNAGWSVFDTLLDRGFLTSSTRTRFMVGVTPPQGLSDDLGIPRLGELELSVWQHYLIREWLTSGMNGR